MARVGVVFRCVVGTRFKTGWGYRGRSKNCYRIAIQRVEKGLQYTYRDRRNRKRDFRALWIQRINAAVRAGGVTYSQFMHALKNLGVMLDRKSLAALAVEEKGAFDALWRKPNPRSHKGF